MLRQVARLIAVPLENALTRAMLYYDSVVHAPLQYVRHCESPMHARSYDRDSTGQVTAQRTLSLEVIARLRAESYVVVDGVLTPEELQNAREDADSLEGFGMNACRGISWQEGDEHQQQGGRFVRTDSVAWVLEDGMGEQSPGQGLLTALRRIRGVALELAQSPSTLNVKLGCWDGFDAARQEAPLGVPLACQLASYGAAPVEPSTSDDIEQTVLQTGYRPHRDGLPLSIVPRWSVRSFVEAGISSREVSALLYLNHAEAFVDSTTGGELVIHIDADDDDDRGGTAARRVSVLPLGGRLVLFDSRRVLHEVRPHTAASARLALTCWIGGRWNDLPAKPSNLRCK